MSTGPSGLLERANHLTTLSEHLAAVVSTARGRLVFIGGELEDLAERGGRPYELAAALMRALRRGVPSIVVIEDLHWADEATIDVLRLLARRIETIPALRAPAACPAGRPPDR